MQIGGKLLDAIAAVLSAAESKRADSALRETLKESRLWPAEKATVTHLVFSYFRWMGWIDRSKPLRGQLEHVHELVEAFATKPESFSDRELLDRALPDWAKGTTTITARTVRAFQLQPRLWLVRESELVGSYQVAARGW